MVSANPDQLVDPASYGATPARTSRFKAFCSLIGGLITVKRNDERDWFALMGVTFVAEFLVVFIYQAIANSVGDALFAAIFLGLAVAVAVLVAAIPVFSVDQRYRNRYVELAVAAGLVGALEARWLLTAVSLSHWFFVDVIVFGPMTAAFGGYFVAPMVVALVHGVKRRWDQAAGKH